MSLADHPEDIYTTRALTWQQWEALGRLQCRITELSVHSYSGDVTVKHGPTTMAIINQRGSIGYGHRWQDGTYVWTGWPLDKVHDPRAHPMGAGDPRATGASVHEGAAA